MTVERLSVSLPPDLAAEIRAAAEAAGWSVSVWVIHAAEDRLVRDRSRELRSRALDELMEMVGPIPDDAHDEAVRWLVEDGLLPPDYDWRRDGPGWRDSGQSAA